MLPGTQKPGRARTLAPRLERTERRARRRIVEAIHRHDLSHGQCRSRTSLPPFRRENRSGTETTAVQAIAALRGPPVAREITQGALRSVRPRYQTACRAVPTGKCG